ncbi:2-oxoacid dehydrogenases acyltransferase (catalytic domain) [Micromonospora eburnea]|uniref:2-oxoacid dehydrogenases acyltransferase (Catalytic domain) n=2 Tax=Micromonospora eburnea TaxID=227316 RepID=A0A1C6V133_9ACTN|nr:2-oxoacid dehydrogenases acyltransferase (catalytic domain) [Micromonospora eburnea]
MRIGPVAPQRRPTLHLMGQLRSYAPVFIDTEVDMTEVRRHRASGRRYSYVTYLLHAAARVLTAHPDANAAIRGRRFPRVAKYSQVNGKLALDATVGGERVVLSCVLPGLDHAGLDDIQDRVEHLRDGDPETMPEFAGIRTLRRLPWPLGALAFRGAMRSLRRRPHLLGTFAVTSLGHRPVDGFYSCGGTTVTLGAGQVADRAVVRDGGLAIAPVMRLSLAFDHRVIDGAEAADVLADIRAALERFPVPVSRADAAAPAPAA